MVGIQLVKTLKFLHLFRYTFLNLHITEVNADLCVRKRKKLCKLARYRYLVGYTAPTAYTRDAVFGYEDNVVN